MIYRKTTGLIAAPFAPFSQSGALDTAVISDYAAFLKERKVAGVFVNGSTGEFASLTTDERKRLAGEWVRFQDDDFRVFIHVGSNSTEEAKELARHAQDAGAAAIAATGPSYFKPSTATHLVGFLREMASAASDTAFYYYHIPALNQNHLQARQVMKQALEEIPSLSGIKFTHEDLMDFQMTRSLAAGRLDALFGRDEILLCGLALGVSGGVGSTYNFMPQLYYKLIDRYRSGDMDEANRLQLQAMEIIEVYAQYQGIPAGKAIMNHLGIRVGNPRLPFLPMNEKESLELFELIREYR